MEERSARRCRVVTDHHRTPASPSELPFSRCSSSCTRSFATLGQSACRCPNGAAYFTLTFVDSDADAKSYEGYRCSTIHDCPHCKKSGSCWQGRKGQGLPGMRYYVRALLFISLSLSPPHQGLYSCTWSPVNCQSILGYHHVYGRRTPGCVIPYG